MPENKRFTDEEFLAAWIKNGYVAYKAYQELVPAVTVASAKTLGARKLAECKCSAVYKSLLSKAYNVLNQSLDSKDGKIALKAAKDLLDRHNGKAKETLKVEGELKVTVVNYADTV